MSFRTTLALCLMVSPLGAAASDLDTPEMTAGATPPAVATPDLIFTFGAGAGIEPAYFGADSYGIVPAFTFGLDYLRLGATRSIGSTDPAFIATGLAPRFSFRSVKERSAADSPELAGLADIDMSVELGMGLIYRQPDFEVFADARYGVVGHESWVGEIGADRVMRPMDGLTLSLGPRLFVGDNDYAATYFGVTPAESVASGLAAFAPAGGALSAGIEFGATYALSDTWGLQGTLRYDRFLGDAAGSPITGLGSDNQFSASLMLTRRFVFDF
jgi:outer membrane scaffolding protein for murein synthesis (MipA/OmpV family)